jgi:glycine oxidase
MAREVIVIGGGVIGCAIAHELTRRGCRVQLVADRALGQGATQASGGMLVPYLEAHDEGPLLDLSVRSLALYDEFVSRTRGDGVADDEEFEYTRRGSVQVSLSQDDAARLQQWAAHLVRQGVRAEWLDAAGLRRAEPMLGDCVVGGLLVSEHGVVGAEALTAALWSAATSNGARFFPGRVTRIRGDGAAVVVEASGGLLHADTVVLAAGAWASRIWIEGEGAPPVSPVRGQLLRVRWEGDPLSRILWGPRCYLVPWRNGMLLIGATLEHVGYDERTTAAAVHDLIDAASELVPHVRAAAFEEARAGLRPGTPDGLPIIGRSRAVPGLVYATGHYRNGVLLAPATAALVGELVIDGREDPLLRSFSIDRFGAHDA